MKSFIKLGPCSTRAMFKKSPCGNIKKVRSLWESELPENMGTLRQGVSGAPVAYSSQDCVIQRSYSVAWRLNIYATGIQGTPAVKIHFDSSAVDSSAPTNIRLSNQNDFESGAATQLQPQLSNQASSCCGSFHLIWARHSTFARPSDFMYIYLVMFDRVLTARS